MRVYLVCYDIEDDDRRRRLSDRLERDGLRVQRSAFELTLDSDSRLAELRGELAELVGVEAGGIRFYRLCAECRGNSFTLAGSAVAQIGGTLIL